MEIIFNKSGTTSNGSYLQGKIDYSYSQSISNNSSTLTCTVYVRKYNDSIKLNQTTNGTFKYTLNVNGTDVTGSKKLEILTTYLQIGSFTINIPHNNDGTKTFNINGSVTLTSNSSSAYYRKTSNVNTNITLPTIPRATIINSVSCNTSYFDGTYTYKYTPQSEIYYNRCNISLNVNGSFVAIKSIDIGKKSASQQTATVKLSDSELDSIYGNLPSTESGTLRFTFRTYSDSGYSTQIGSALYEEITRTIPTSIKPSIGGLTLSPINFTTSDGTSRNILVKDKNGLKITASGCSAGTGSSISSYTFSGANVSSMISNNSITISKVSTSGSLTYTVKVQDKRGRSASKSATITCYDYNPDDLKFSSFTAYRCNSNGTADNNGTFIKYNFKINYPVVDGTTNKCTVKIYYKQSSNSSWTAAANALEDSTTKDTSGIIKRNGSGDNISFDATLTYAVYAVLVDNYNQSTQSSVVTIFGASRIFNIRGSGTGVAFGKMAEVDNLLESKWPLQVDGAISFGDSGTFGKIYADTNGAGTNIVYIQTGQQVDGGTDMSLSINKSGVYVASSANDGKVNLGSSGRKWNQLYAANGTISTSDRNKKTNIVDMNSTQEQLFNKLRPVTFELKNGSSGRTHYGFISQDIEDSLSTLNLTGKDFAGFCKDLRVDENGEAILDENGKEIYDYSLRYSEFIALNTHMIQKLQNEIVELKSEIAELKSSAKN